MAAPIQQVLLMIGSLFSGARQFMLPMGVYVNSTATRQWMSGDGIMVGER